ncbi:MAG: glutamine-hydrolyzing carbamoyl-phosphate synthase small subunit [Victivallaceae bacterium]|nr:glutamine-hydrolyzing carbamoyl-phosphate synthase small subunit [Victivallaceae bacterium]
MDRQWKAKRERKAFLALADGTVFPGWSFGCLKDAAGEAVFNTGMTGYQEILTDPSYAGQFVLLTAPEIGNYGVNSRDVESRDLFLQGLLVRELNEPSNYRSEESLETYLMRHGKPGLAGLDTRGLTLHLRNYGSQKAYMHVENTFMSHEEGVERARLWSGLDGVDTASLVSTPVPYDFNEQGKHFVCAYDFGIKTNILRLLAEHDMKVRVFPAGTPASELLAAKPDGIFLSNGPGDPAAVVQAQDNIKFLLGKVPLMGICLGHQLLGLACGGRTIKLKFGHHGCNHPVKNLAADTVEITSQNHNYALEETSLPPCLEVTHRNLNDQTVEGVRHRELPAFSVQYHPEAAPGPCDSTYLFDTFQTMMEKQ